MGTELARDATFPISLLAEVEIETLGEGPPGPGDSAAMLSRSSMVSVCFRLVVRSRCDLPTLPARDVGSGS